MSEPTKIYIDSEVWGSIIAYARKCPVEVSGFAHFDQTSRQIDRIYPILKQVCHGAETEMDVQALAEFYTTKAGREANVFWHSHVNMNAFWSPGDNETINALSKHMPYLVSIVVNKRSEYKCRVDLATPFRITVENIELKVDYVIPAKALKRIQEEIKAKVNEPKWAQKSGFDATQSKYIEIPIANIGKTQAEQLKRMGYFLSTDGKFLLKERPTYGGGNKR